LQTYTDWAIGWIHSTRGDVDAGIEACERSLAGSRDAFNTAAALGWSGFAYMDKDPAKAIPRLERSIDLFIATGYEPILGWFKAWLGDALLRDGDRGRARVEATQAVEIGRRFDNAYSVGLAKRVLGCIALGEDDLLPAQALLEQALDTFEGI